MLEYIEFIKNKRKIAVNSGFRIEETELNDQLFEWQNKITRWALRKGKAALFEECGLGKTFQQLEWAKQVCAKTGGNVLIVSPLTVTGQTKKEGLRFGIDANICRNQREVKSGINITNYEMLHEFKLSEFAGIVLDESSILKNYSGKIRTQLINLCKDIPYKLCCTATPAPNDYMEIGNHSEFLDVMSRSEMLSTFFVHDGGDTSKWRLKKHAEGLFWDWVASWAIVLKNPKDIGYTQEGFELPPLEIIEHVVKSKNKIDDDGQMRFISKHALTLMERKSARRESTKERVSKAAEIANEAEGQVIAWCDLNKESDMLKNNIRGAVEVKGADSIEHKIDAANGFSNGDVRVLVSKPSICGWGMNWQNCNEMIFVGLSDSFEAFYQAVRRCYRFGQKNTVKVHIVISEEEGAVRENILRKQKQTEAMQREMAERTKATLIENLNLNERKTENYIASEDIEVPKWLISG